MDSYTIANWKDFFIAVSGGAAAFAGLLFVGLSINLARIIAMPGMPGRAAEALFLLVSVLVSALMGLVPQTSAALGYELLCIGSAVWIVTTYLSIHAVRRHLYDTALHIIQRVVSAQIATLPLLIGAASFLLHRGGGLYWLVPGQILPLLVGMMDAWVLLVEIMR